MSNYTPVQGERRAREAHHLFATFLMLNDNYLPGALILADSLRRQGLREPMVCLTTEGVSSEARQALRLLYDDVIEVDLVYVPHVRRQERQDRPYYFTRINVLRLGPDGDLGYRCQKVTVIDADVLALDRYDTLFQLTAPAGIINERKESFVETDDAGHFAVSERTWKTGEWRWHDIYRSCLHGQCVPREITDRVAADPANMGINGSLFVMQPKAKEFHDIIADLRRPEVSALVGDSFDWPDMQYLTMRWSGKWHNIDARFSALSGYPDLSLVWGTHFAGFKPWYFQRSATMRRYVRFPDFQMWFGFYLEMLQRSPGLAAMGKLRRLQQAISAVVRTDDSNDSDLDRRVR